MRDKIFLSALVWILIFSGCPREPKDAPAQAQEISATAPNSPFRGNKAGARGLLEQFLQPGADFKTLTQTLRPNSADFTAVFSKEVAQMAERNYQLPWDQGHIVVHGNPEQTELVIWSATSEELKKGKGDAKKFPGGYVQAAPYFNDGLTFYGFRFIRPGEKLGYAWDGLVHVNGHWVIFPKPWRVLTDYIKVFESKPREGEN